MPASGARGTATREPTLWRLMTLEGPPRMLLPPLPLPLHHFRHRRSRRLPAFCMTQCRYLIWSLSSSAAPPPPHPPQTLLWHRQRLRRSVSWLSFCSPSAADFGPPTLTPRLFCDSAEPTKGGPAKRPQGVRRRLRGLGGWPSRAAPPRPRRSKPISLLIKRPHCPPMRPAHL